MAEPFKNQHIVPQSYLNRFAERKGKKYVIGTRFVDVGTNEVKFFTRAVADVAYREYYYDTSVQSDPKYWEHYFCNEIDSLYGKPLESILSDITAYTDEESVLKQEDIHTLAKIIFTQIVRVPDYLEHFIQYLNKVAAAYKADILPKLPNLSKAAKGIIEKFFSTDDELKNFVLERSLNAEKMELFCAILEDKVWVVYYNSVCNLMPFATSDNPVLMMDKDGNIVRLTDLGLLSGELSIMFPLSPSVLIGIYSPCMYDGKISGLDNRKLVLTEKDIKFIMKQNLAQIENCYIHSFLPEPLYSMVKGDL